MHTDGDETVCGIISKFVQLIIIHVYLACLALSVFIRVHLWLKLGGWAVNPFHLTATSSCGKLPL